MILLVAMVAAISLTLRTRKDAKRQRPGLQVRVRSSDRVRIVQVDAVSERAAARAAGVPEQVGAAGAADAGSTQTQAIK